MAFDFGSFANKFGAVGNIAKKAVTPAVAKNPITVLARSAAPAPVKKYIPAPKKSLPAPETYDPFAMMRTNAEKLPPSAPIAKAPDWLGVPTAKAANQPSSLMDFLESNNPAPLKQNFTTSENGFGFDDILPGMAEAGYRGLTGFAEGTGNLLGTATDAVAQVGGYGRTIPKVGGDPGDIFRGGGKFLSDSVRGVQSKLNEGGLKDHQLNLDSGAGEFGGFLGNLAAQVPGILAGHNVEQASKAAGIGPVLSNILGGAVHTTNSYGATDGRLPTPTEYAQGAAIDTVFGLLEKIAPVLYRAGVNPDAPTSREVERRAQEAIDMNLTGSKSTIRKKAEKYLDDLGRQMDDLIPSKPIPGYTTKSDLANAAVEQATKLEKIGDIDGSNRLIKFIEKFRADEAVLTAKDVLEIKRMARKVIEPLLQKGTTGSLTTTAKKQFWEAIYKSADDALNTVSPNVRQINQQMRTAYSVLDPVEAQLRKAPRVGVDMFNIINKFTSLLTRLGGASKVNPIIKQIVKNAPASENTQKVASDALLFAFDSLSKLLGAGMDQATGKAETEKLDQLYQETVPSENSLLKSLQNTTPSKGTSKPIEVTDDEMQLLEDLWNETQR